MTEPEPKTWSARLTRIWEPDGQGLIWDGLDHGFRGRLVVGVCFEFWLFPYTFAIYSLEGRDQGLLETLDAHLDESAFDHYELKQGAPYQFASHWLPLFRRGVWLSGVLIEASAHEKAEWIQGFSQEEIEAWNLKM